MDIANSLATAQPDTESRLAIAGR
eukprot:SAG25_NODE_4335_length_837_cov_1.882114_1_plen_23_part_01